MAFNVVIKSIVFIDVEEAVNFYESRSKEIGERFYKSFLQSLKNIELSPSNYSYVRFPVRRHIIKKFPYKIYFIISMTRYLLLELSM